MRRASVLCAALALLGCGAMTRGARVQIDQDRSQHARTLDVATHAPVPYARYQRARRAAGASDAGSHAHAAHSLEARLWLETAIAEAELHVLSRKRLAEEQALVALDAQLLARAHERGAHEREAQLEAARAIVRSEVDKALARAAARPAQRVKLSRDGARAAAEALVLRARLVSMTLAALMPASDTVARLEAQLTQAEALRERDPERSLTLSDQALFRALSLLAEVRGSEPGPRPEEREALIEALRSIGLEAVRDDRGLGATLAPAFRGEGPAPGVERTLSRLCALALAHPHGRLQLGVQSARGAAAEARLRRVRQLFAQAGCTGVRYVFQPAPRAGDALEALWLAY